VNWWVVTKLDVLDELDEVPVCVGYKVNGKKTESIPALATGFETVECIYENMPGWKTSTEGITSFDKLPKKAQTYLQFLEKESGAKIGMVSTGPDRDQTMFMPEFEAEIMGTQGPKIAKAK
jgi:adenylosuccinate synthase